ncbi:hypothetical protein BGZ82_002476, partial [Podila clonocystis]
MFFASVIVSFSHGQYFKKDTEACVEIRGGLISMIYRKALVLVPAAKNNVGEITNHMSNDVEAWTSSLSLMALWIVIPFEIIVCTTMLYNTMGWSALCGLVCIAISTPIQSWVGGFLNTARYARMGAMDSRIQLISEVLGNIKIIKLYAYEGAFRSKIQSFRTTELAVMRKTGKVLAALSLVYTCFPFLMAFFSFAVYATIGGPNFTPGEINAQVVFVSMTLFGLLLQPVASMSSVMGGTVSIRVATGRIQAFLLKEELDPCNIVHEPMLPKDPTAPVIVLDNATFAWKAENAACGPGNNEQASETTALLPSNLGQNNEPTLSNVSVEILRGHLTAVVGRVGQGKSSLLSAIIGDMYKRQGHAKICGSVAYVPQQAWIVNASVRDNITFGKAFDKERYDYILFASGLLPDLAILAAGDQTEIGERGINLSGGQKQRLSLARAAYQDADIYLLDDPLSAVDAHVDQHLWTHLIGPEGLLKNKTRVLVTHGINHLEHVDHILVIKDGQVSEKGHYKTLIKAKLSFYQLIKEFSVTHRNKKNQKKKDQKSSESSIPSSSSTSVSGDESGTIVEEDETEKEGGSGELVGDEEVNDGLVTWKTFASYCKLMSYYYAGLILFTFVLWQIFQLSIPFWLQHWTATVDTKTHSTSYYLGVYAALMVGYMVVDVYLTFMSTVDAPLHASKALHESLLVKVLRLPMSFFDTTPQGRVLNRFSNDIAGADEHIPEALLSFMAGFFNLVGSLLILCFVTPVFLFAIPVLVVFYLLLQAYYLRNSNVLRRLDAVARSPLYQHFAETLNGVSSIRAMQLSSLFTARNDAHANTSSNGNYAVLMTNRWLASRIE